MPPKRKRKAATAGIAARNKRVTSSSRASKPENETQNAPTERDNLHDTLGRAIPSAAATRNTAFTDATATAVEPVPVASSSSPTSETPTISTEQQNLNNVLERGGTVQSFEALVHAATAPTASLEPEPVARSPGDMNPTNKAPDISIKQESLEDSDERVPPFEGDDNTALEDLATAAVAESQPVTEIAETPGSTGPTNETPSISIKQESLSEESDERFPHFERNESTALEDRSTAAVAEAEPVAGSSGATHSTDELSEASTEMKALLEDLDKSRPPFVGDNNTALQNPAAAAAAESQPVSEIAETAGATGPTNETPGILTRRQNSQVRSFGLISDIDETFMNENPHTLIRLPRVIDFARYVGQDSTGALQSYADRMGTLRIL